MKFFTTILAVLLLASLSFAQQSEKAPDATNPAIEEPAPSTGMETEPPAPPEGTIILQIDGLRKIKGNLRCRLYNSDETFPSKDESKMFAFREVPVNAETATISFEKLPFGNYGVVVHHDWDADGKVDKTWYHAPKEPVACSNDAKGSFGPPSWNDAVFELNQPRLEVPIHFSK